MLDLEKQKIITDAFVRVCRDSGYQLEASRAANIAAKMTGHHPLQVWAAVGTLDLMDRIASGEYRPMEA